MTKWVAGWMRAAISRAATAQTLHDSDGRLANGDFIGGNGGDCAAAGDMRTSAAFQGRAALRSLRRPFCACVVDDGLTRDRVTA